MSAVELESFTQRLHCSTADARLLRQVLALKEALSDLGARAMLRSTLHQLLHPYSREARFVLSVLADARLVARAAGPVRARVGRVAPSVDGDYLRSLGLPPGPIYRAILDRLQGALLDGQIATLAQEQALARALAEQALHP